MAWTDDDEAACKELYLFADRFKCHLCHTPSSYPDEWKKTCESCQGWSCAICCVESQCARCLRRHDLASNKKVKPEDVLSVGLPQILPPNFQPCRLPFLSLQADGLAKLASTLNYHVSVIGARRGVGATSVAAGISKKPWLVQSTPSGCSSGFLIDEKIALLDIQCGTLKRSQALDLAIAFGQTCVGVASNIHDALTIAAELKKSLTVFLVHVAASEGAPPTDEKDPRVQEVVKWFGRSVARRQKVRSIVNGLAKEDVIMVVASEEPYGIQHVFVAEELRTPDFAPHRAKLWIGKNDAVWTFLREQITLVNLPSVQSVGSVYTQAVANVLKQSVNLRRTGSTVTFKAAEGAIVWEQARPQAAGVPLGFNDVTHVTYKVAVEPTWDENVNRLDDDSRSYTLTFTMTGLDDPNVRADVEKQLREWDVGMYFETHGRRARSTLTIHVDGPGGQVLHAATELEECNIGEANTEVAIRFEVAGPPMTTIVKLQFSPGQIDEEIS